MGGIERDLEHIKTNHQVILDMLEKIKIENIS